MFFTNSATCKKEIISLRMSNRILPEKLLVSTRSLVRYITFRDVLPLHAFVSKTIYLTKNRSERRLLQCTYVVESELRSTQQQQQRSKRSIKRTSRGQFIVASFTIIELHVESRAESNYLSMKQNRATTCNKIHFLKMTTLNKYRVHFYALTFILMVSLGNCSNVH